MKRVTIVGGGIAGLTAALRLTERGYGVTLYERQTVLGGNLASRPIDAGVSYDVYPHMYLNWYHNFWNVVSDVTGARRDELFTPMSNIKRLSKGDFPRYTQLTDTFSPLHAVQNLFSGAASPADMFLFMYASVDLLAEHINPTTVLKQLSLNGFLFSRPYTTGRVAELFDSWVTLVWAIPSYLVSASDYQTFLKHGYAEPVPALWILRGNAGDRVIDPIAKAIEDAGGEIHLATEVLSVHCDRGTVESIEVRTDGQKRTEAVADLILAVPPAVLSRLIRTGGRGHRIVEAEPALADVARLWTEAIPVVHVCFTRRLPHIPPEPVGLVGSRFGLAFTDVSHTLERGDDRTILALSASDRYGLPGPAPRDDAMAMIRELAQYVTAFEPGEYWGDSPDIDWKRTSIDRNVDTQLFVNETGSDGARPHARCDHLDNLYLAGDFCSSDIGLTSIEAAVVTGLNAAQAIVERRGTGLPVEIVPPTDFPASFFAWLRLAWAPYAAAAKLWSIGTDILSLSPRTARERWSILRSLVAPTPSRLQR